MSGSLTRGAAAAFGTANAAVVGSVEEAAEGERRVEDVAEGELDGLSGVEELSGSSRPEEMQKSHRVVKPHGLSTEGLEH